MNSFEVFSCILTIQLVHVYTTVQCFYQGNVCECGSDFYLLGDGMVPSAFLKVSYLFCFQEKINL